MPLPTSVQYGAVKWTAISAAADGADGDLLPDAVPVTGQVTFKPRVTGPLLSISTTPPVTVFPTPVSYTLDADGILRDSGGSDTIYLVATDSAGLTPINWTWQATYNLGDGLVMGSFDFALPQGTTIDLTTVAPVSSSSGTPIIQGPAPTILGTSSTSLTPTTGSTTFTTQSGIAYQVGTYVRAASAANPSVYMAGPITAYSGTTLTVNVTETSGGSAAADWKISLTGAKGSTGATGAGVPSGGTSGQIIQYNGTTAVWYTPVSGATTASSIPKRDASGRLQAAAGAAATDVAVMSQIIPAFADPNVDQIVFWDDSAGAWVGLTPSAPLSISGTNLLVGSADTANAGVSRLATTAESIAGTLSTVANTPAGLKAVADTKANVQFTKNTITANYTLVAADASNIVLHSTATGAGINITLPQDTAATIGQEIAIPWRQYGTAQMTFVAGTGATVLFRGAVTKSAGQYAEGTVTKVAANTWLVSGDLA